MKMKLKAIFLLTPFIILASCKKDKNVSDAYGNFTATEITVSAELSGKVILKNAVEGNKVDSALVVYIIDTVQNNLKRDELIAKKQSVLAKKINISAQIDIFREQKKSLDADIKRFTLMKADGAASEKQLDDLLNQNRILEKQIDQVKTNYVAIDAEMSAMNASLAQTNDLISRAIVKSPISGTVLETYAETGEIVTAGKALFKIARMDVMELKAYFSGEQLPLLKLGQKVEVITDNGSGGYNTCEGTVAWIASEAEFTPKIIQTRKERIDLVYAVKIRVKNDGTLKINMPGEVRLPETRKK